MLSQTSGHPGVLTTCGEAFPLSEGPKILQESQPIPGQYHNQRDVTEVPPPADNVTTSTVGISLFLLAPVCPCSVLVNEPTVLIDDEDSNPQIKFIFKS